MKEHRDEYLNVEVDTSDIVNQQQQLTPHEWNEGRFSTLAHIREVSLHKTIEHNCDFYFVVDCDNFLAPETLQHLVNLQRPIVGPMLKPIPNPREYYSNFFANVNKYGYYENSPNYLDYRFNNKTGCFEVPVVHCTYLIQREYLPYVMYIDGTKAYEFVIFSKSTRDNNVKQYLCNEIPFGSLCHPPDNVILEEEQELFEKYKANNPLIF